MAAPANPEVARLTAERARGNFDTQAMTVLLAGGEEQLRRKTELRQMVERRPVFSNRDTMFLNHTQLYNRGLQKAAAFLELLREEGITDPEEVGYLKSQLSFVLPVDVHMTMFVPTLANQTTPEQRARWLPDALSGRILGAYAQTELGHGSNVRGLETTATYDKATQEFVVHSPTLTSTKWWPGGLGRTANHCVAHCRLIIDGTDHGVHPFFVPLRDMDTHQPLPGVSLGDIGPKMGFNSIDNGWARFDSVRIPRENMLMKYQRVEPDGTYVKPPHSKLSYGTMILIRANLVKGAAAALARAVTICTRFSAARVQGNARGGQETAVLDYQEQQAQLFPLLAAAYASHFTGQRMYALYQRTMAGLQGGDTALLPETHATSAGLKALVTYVVSDGIEACRRLSGGHGYSCLSGLPQMFGGYVAVATLEGTREVLALQTARYLLKAVAGGADVPYLRSPESTAKHCDAHTPADFSRPELLVAAFAARAARVVRGAAERVAGAQRAGASADEARQRCMVDLVRASEAHCEYILVRNFAEALASPAEVPPALAGVLRPLLALFALWRMERGMGDFRDGDYLSSAQARMAHDHFVALLAEVRPNAVALTDAWGFSDAFLNSAIGAADGDIYRRLFEWAQNEPLNDTQVAEGVEKWIKPMQSRL